LAPVDFASVAQPSNIKVYFLGLGEGSVENPLWFEKTVEYRFALDILDREAMVSPLAGHAEKWWGDLIDGRGVQFRLIEFKKSEASINTELAKYMPVGAKPPGIHYTTYISQTLNSPLLDLPGARGHWLIFGALPDAAACPVAQCGFELRARQYGEADPGRSFTLDSDLQLGRVSAAELHAYLLELKKLRASRGTSTSGGLVLATVGASSAMWTTQEFFFISERVLGLSPGFPPQPPKQQQEISLSRGR